MKEREEIVSTEGLRVKQGKETRLKDFDTGYTGDLTKERGIELLDASRKTLAAIQDKLYAHNRYSVLIIFQAMDAAGKDGAVKHIMSGFNPLGVKVTSFKTPTPHELEHDFFWRHYLALPARGEIAIHNRSHYENVLITRVHPEYVLQENIPGIGSVADITDDFWEDRFKQINRFEKNLVKNGTVIIKFFLHLSKKEQKKRFLERIDDPSKNWKFSTGDIQERAHWKEYQEAYEQAINATSQDHAPWFIIPADDKWYARLAIASVIAEKFEALDIRYPSISEEQKAALQKARTQLTGEE
ncbi:polyphosphate kinase 2 family protein [Fulvivirgaceae bacterium PWU5]|uniref:Polyphosphate kinase 2 family protein n=2 Tax=Dawidia cretensis TaxID=2782350 RepID=A0AAP2E3P3_9BACT|nr:polyphosphate kinase 2 family protein [Dawidia cretensis]